MGDQSPFGHFLAGIPGSCLRAQSASQINPFPTPLVNSGTVHGPNSKGKGWVPKKRSPIPFCHRADFFIFFFSFLSLFFFFLVASLFVVVCV